VLNLQAKSLIFLVSPGKIIFPLISRYPKYPYAIQKSTVDLVVLMLFSNIIMQQSFPEFYAEDLRRTFAEHSNCLYPAFLEVAATIASINRPPYRKKSRVIQIPGRYDLDALADRIMHFS
jgi:hypothetical protein